MRSAWSIVWLSATLSLGAGCPGRRDASCGKRDATQCAWERAVGSTRRDEAVQGGVEGWFDPRTPTRTREDEWTRATEILGEAWTLMGEGVEGSAVAVQARKWCAPDPTLPPAEEGPWSCELADAPAFDGRALQLEVGKDGVVSLSLPNIGEGEATAILKEAARRWGPLCNEEGFGDFPGRGAAGVYRGCVLQDGPLLVLARFIPEGEVALWQISLSVMPAG